MARSQPDASRLGSRHVMADPALIESRSGLRLLDEWGASTLIEAELPRRVIRAAALMAALAGVGFALLYQLTGPPEFTVPNLIAAAAFVAIAAVQRVEADVRMLAAATIANLLLAYQLVLVGQIENGISIWFAVPTFAAMVLGLRRTTVFCVVSAGVVLLAVVAAARAGLLVPTVTIPAGDLVMAASMIGVLLLCALFAYLAVHARRRLAREVDAQTAALANALAEARAARLEALSAIAAKDRFFANLTHEIRTPLTGIAGSAELLAGAGLEGEEGLLADSLLSSTRGLAALVNAMLDHARLAAGHATVERGAVDPRQMARELESLYGPPAAEHGLTLGVAVADDVPAEVGTDGLRLRQILGNLVANALKFTDRGSVSVSLAWDAGDPGAGTLIATVVDTGPGIPPRLRDAVFEPFVQGDTSIRRRHGGTGLGLAIARQLAELLGGSISLESEVGAGSTFTVRVPASASPEIADPPAPPEALPADAPEPRPPAAGPPLGLAGLRVLLVEDNEINRTVAAAILRRSGMEVVLAASGSEAISLAARPDLDVILMDLQMPGVDGIEATRRIRAAESERGSPRLPIVAMTGNSLEDYGEACEAAGMDAFVVKPVTSAALREVVERTLAGA
jgi:signal transduction histidine kinase/CheY-like chemotaxis protein